MALSNVQLQRANDIQTAADRVETRAQRLHVRGKDHDPGDFIPPVYYVDALDELLEEEKIVLHAHVTRTAILDAIQARL